MPFWASRNFYCLCILFHCVLFSVYCIVLISFVLAMRKWCIPALAIQSSYVIIWWLLLYTISCCGLIN